MELNNFARIGKGVLSKAIGLQKNYIEEYVKGPDKLNECKSNCYNCDICRQKKMYHAIGNDAKVDKLLQQCQECPNAVWESSYTASIRYINEKNRYGYQPTLKSNAIKLLLLYHFLQPDALGFIQNINLDWLATTVGCTKATVIACNEVLQSYSYCYICDSGVYDHHINIYLPEYRNYHKTAAEGGRGYITMSSDLLLNLFCIKGLNTLRLNLKGILEVDNASYSDTTKDTLSVVTSQYKKLRGFLPGYCKNNIIRKALEANDAIFDLTFNDKSKSVTFAIKGKYAQKHLRESMRSDIKTSLIEHVEHINTILDNAASAKLAPDKEKFDAILSTFNIDSSERYPVLCIKLSDYDDLTALALQYNLPLVHMAISTIYNKYILHNSPVECIGALARTVIRNNSIFYTAA